MQLMPTAFVARILAAAFATTLLLPAGVAWSDPPLQPSTTTMFLRTGATHSYQAACTNLILLPQDGADWPGCSGELLKELPPCPFTPVCRGPEEPLVWRTGSLEEPLVLDVSRPVDGLVGVGSWTPGVCSTIHGCTDAPSIAVGSYSVTVTLDARLATGELVEVGSDQTEYVMIPGQEVEFDFSFDIPEPLHGTSVTSLDFAVSVSGQGAMHGIIEMEDPASRFHLPTFVCENEPCEG